MPDIIFGLDGNSWDSLAIICVETARLRRTTWAEIAWPSYGLNGNCLTQSYVLRRNCMAVFCVETACKTYGLYRNWLNPPYGLSRKFLIVLLLEWNWLSQSSSTMKTDPISCPIEDYLIQTYHLSGDCPNLTLAWRYTDLMAWVRTTRTLCPHRAAPILWPEWENAIIFFSWVGTAPVLWPELWPLKSYDSSGGCSSPMTRVGAVPVLWLEWISLGCGTRWTVMKRSHSYTFMWECNIVSSVTCWLKVFRLYCIVSGKVFHHHCVMPAEVFHLYCVLPLKVFHFYCIIPVEVFHLYWIMPVKVFHLYCIITVKVFHLYCIITV